MRGKAYLQNKLNCKRIRVLLRYKYYEGKNDSLNPSRIVDARLEGLYNSSLGWCAKGVDALSDRIVFREFEDDNFGLNEIFQLNNPDTFSRSAIHEALIGACSFVYISKGDDGYPQTQVVDASNATGEMDPITGLLTEGYAVLARDDLDNVLMDAYLTPQYTEIYDGKSVKRFTHNVGHPLLVPIPYRPDAKRPFGHSAISRACMSLVDKARYTLTRADITSEFYSFPQKYVLGMSQDAEPLDTWRATISSMLQITADEDGNKPSVGQFQQAAVTPHLEQFKLYASAFAGETGLTLDDLGFPTANPSSAEAIKAAHENLRLNARAAQKTFGSGLLNVGYLAACLRDDIPYKRNALYMTKPVFEPIFEPDAAMMSSIGDGMIKINQAIPEYIDEEKASKLLGL